MCLSANGATSAQVHRPREVFSRQEYWRELLFPSLGDLPDPGIEPAPLASLARADGFFTTSSQADIKM